MTTLIFDTEGDGFLRKATRLWCVVIIDADTGVVSRYNDVIGTQRDGTVHQGVERLLAADRIVAHNGVGYDFPVIEKLFKVKLDREKCHDTMVYGRLFNPSRPGGHSIEAYGEAFGIKKDAEMDDFTQWSQRLEDRCVDDTRTGYMIWKTLEEKGVLGWGQAPWIEMRFAELIALQMENGFTLNARLAMEVAAECADEIAKLNIELAHAFPPRFVPVKKGGVPHVFTPKKDLARYGYTAGAAFVKLEIEEFNAESGQQIADRFIKKYGWVPTKFTETGEPATDEEVLKNLDYPEAKILARFMRIDKMWKQIAAPKKANGTGGGWLHHIDPETGKVHGYVNSNGAVTGRCTHSRPNTANIDKKDKRMRAMWIPRPDWGVLLGFDAEGLELRMLAHYLAAYDGLAYSRAVTEGRKEDKTDVHSITQQIVGLYKRDNAKRVIYAMIYGAGDAKLGLIIVEDAVEADKYNPTDSPQLFNEKGKRLAMSKLGKAAREKLETGIVGLGDLKKAVIRKVKQQGWIRGLDGRRLRIRSEHSALNTLLQGGGALVMKLALILFYLEVTRRGYVHGVDYGFCANVHDEVQIECRTRALAEEFGPLSSECIKEAGVRLGVRCPLAGSYDIGKTWAETH